MKKTFNIIMTIVLLLFLVSCNGKNEVKDYSVVFYSDGGSFVETYMNIEPGSKIEEPTSPEKANSTFDGWFKDIELTEKWDFKEMEVTESITLYVKWDYEFYTITYNLSGGYFPTTVNEGDYPKQYNISSATIFLVKNDPSKKPARTNSGSFRGWRTISEEAYSELDSSQQGDYPFITTIPKGSSGDFVLFAFYR